MSIVVVKPGLQTTLQSRPRIGLRHLGVPAGGAADPLSLALANKVVGNDWDAPALEIALLGPTLRFEAACAIGFGGGNFNAVLNGRSAPLYETLRVDVGDELRIAAARAGARVYLAVAGGLRADTVLGSASTEPQAGFGGHHGRALIAGDVLEFDCDDCDDIETPDAYRPPMASSWALRACASAETDLLDAAGKAALFGDNWTLDRRGDRVGLRLQGRRLEVASDGRMPSAPVFPGTVQCPEDGSPYVLSVDGGTVGGYPRIAEVTRADRHLLGQLRPGDRLRLLYREPDTAIEELRAKQDYWRPWLPDIEAII